QHLKMSLELNENSPPARAAYGRCLLELNQVQEAVVQLRKAVELDPSNATAYYQLARAYQRSGDAAAAQEALKMYEKLKDI
ncbi:MAG: tetratricopeptide repeat protein, partial [Acidobacteria bacterium]|nr:tetratricopeptide repeat protein [Acidobacteriota bacterium]